MIKRRNFLKGGISLFLLGLPSYISAKPLQNRIEENKELLLNDEANRKTLEETFSRITQYDDYIALASYKWGLKDYLLRAIIATESNGDPRKISKVGAVGLMQLMPGTAKELGIRMNGFVDYRMHPEDSIFGGSTYLRELIKEFGKEIGLAAYNRGHTFVRKLVKKFGNDYNEIEKHLPKETREYVVRVLSREQALRGNIKVEEMPLFSNKLRKSIIHEVEKGQELWGISRDYGVGVKDVEGLNPEVRDYSMLYPGQKINIPKAV